MVPGPADRERTLFVTTSWWTRRVYDVSPAGPAEIEVPVPAAVRGRLVHPGPVPADVHVGVPRPGPPARLHLIRDPETGAFTLHGIPAGTRRIEIRAAGAAPRVLGPFVLEPGETRDLGTVALAPVTPR